MAGNPFSRNRNTRKDSIPPGTPVKIEGYRAKSGEPDTEAGAGCKGQTLAVDYAGRAAAPTG